MFSEAKQTTRLFNQSNGYIEMDKFQGIFNQILVEKGKDPNKYNLTELIDMIQNGDSPDMMIIDNKLIFIFTEFNQEWIEHMEPDESKKPIFFPVMCGFLKDNYEIVHDEDEIKFIEEHKPYFLKALSEYFGYNILDDSEIKDAMCVNIADYEALYKAYREKFPDSATFLEFMREVWDDKTEDYLEKFRYWNTSYQK